MVSKQNFIKYGLLFFAFTIAISSLYYTNILVQKLGEREQKLIDLYAKGLQSAAQPDEMGNLSFLFQEIIQANNSVPVILTDENQKPLSFKNLDINESFSETEKNRILNREIEEMKKMYPPIGIEFSPGFKNYIFYKNSSLLNQLKLYPYVQLTVIFLFILLGYFALNSSLKAEQNRVWVGMAKETAHQLGTPLSSLMAWIEIFKTDDTFSHQYALEEIEKDVIRLETVTARFSNIGSKPVLKLENLFEVVNTLVAYLKKRISNKIDIEFVCYNTQIPININKPLFEWALENIIKNAVDAMGSIGKIEISITQTDEKNINILIADNGKGMTKKIQKQIFNPGFTTKQRGWGLGLTLTKRIIDDYHKGKIFIKSSEIGKGTTFCIILKNN